MVNFNTMSSEPAVNVAGRNISAKPVASAPDVAHGSGRRSNHTTG